MQVTTELDELSLMIQPIVVGSGMRLFDELTYPVSLRLAESKALGTGVLAVTYVLPSSW